MTTAVQPDQKSITRMERYVEKYRQKSGTSAHPDPAITEAVSFDRC
jgi:ferredoxin-thioredoxin reductase catalytic subunit